jgi:hypothetical protein
MWTWVPLERPQLVQSLGRFPAFYGTRRFITKFTRALHLYLSWARPIQSTTLNLTSKRFILMLSIHLRLGLPSGLFPSDNANTCSSYNYQRASNGYITCKMFFLGSTPGHTFLYWADCILNKSAAVYVINLVKLSTKRRLKGWCENNQCLQHTRSFSIKHGVTKQPPAVSVGTAVWCQLGSNAELRTRPTWIRPFSVPRPT